MAEEQNSGRKLVYIILIAIAILIVILIFYFIKYGNKQEVPIISAGGWCAPDSIIINENLSKKGWKSNDFLVIENLSYRGENVCHIEKIGENEEFYINKDNTKIYKITTNQSSGSRKIEELRIKIPQNKT